MNSRQPYRHARGCRATVLVSLMVISATVSDRLRADTQTTGTCGGVSVTTPFTDVANTNLFFCSIAAAYFSGLTNGTSATTFSPSQDVPREQMAAFVTRTLDQSLRRGSRRAALRQWWTPTVPPIFSVSGNPQLLEADGQDIWVASEGEDSVARVNASSGLTVQVWTGATNAYGVVVARGKVWVTGVFNPGLLWRLNPRADAPTVPAELEAGDLGGIPQGITFDGSSIWTANLGGSVSIRSSPGSNGALTTTVTNGFVAPLGILFDGSNIWVTDQGDDRLKKLNADASVAVSIPMGSDPGHAVFDGMNIWVPNQFSNSVIVVRAKDSQGNPLASPFVLTTLTGNGLNDPRTAAFDGQRILVTNNSGNSVSLWKATDFTPLGFVQTGANTKPLGACSDGINFFVTCLSGITQRF